MKLVQVNSSPFIVPVTPDPANYAANKISVRSSAGGETIVLPLIADLQSNEVDIFITASGSVTVETQGADVFADGSTSKSSVGSIFVTPVAGNVWFSR
jgi:archaellum component FlaF (FlaF/FlaG flagellin family)